MRISDLYNILDSSDSTDTSSFFDRINKVFSGAFKNYFLRGEDRELTDYEKLQLALVLILAPSNQNKRFLNLSRVFSLQLTSYLAFCEGDPQLKQYAKPFISSLKNVNDLAELNMYLENINYFYAVVSLLKEKNLFPADGRQKESLLSSLRNNINSMQGIYVILNYALRLSIADMRKMYEYINQAMRYAEILNNARIKNIISNIPDHWRFRDSRIVDEIFVRCQNSEDSSAVFTEINAYMRLRIASSETPLRAAGMLHDAAAAIDVEENIRNSRVFN